MGDRGSKELRNAGGGCVVRILLITGIALLTGCESEFDRCMATEIPKAEAALGWAEEQEVAAVIRALSSEHDLRRKVELAMREWRAEHPLPSEGVKSEEGAAWSDAQKAYHLEVSRSLGTEEKTWEGLVERYRRNDGLFEQYVQPRSLTARCRLSIDSFPECRGVPNVLEDFELKTEADFNTYGEAHASEFRNALAEALAANEEALTRLPLDIRGQAASVCNSHGIYE